MRSGSVPRDGRRMQRRWSSKPARTVAAGAPGKSVRLGAGDVIAHYVSPTAIVVAGHDIMAAGANAQAAVAGMAITMVTVKGAPTPQIGPHNSNTGPPSRSTGPRSRNAQEVPSGMAASACAQGLPFGMAASANAQEARSGMATSACAGQARAGMAASVLPSRMLTAPLGASPAQDQRGEDARDSIEACRPGNPPFRSRWPCGRRGSIRPAHQSGSL
jgi:hypothetical protein